MDGRIDGIYYTLRPVYGMLINIMQKYGFWNCMREVER